MAKIYNLNIYNICKPKDILKTKEWRIARFLLLKKFRRCMKCKSTADLQIDHIKPISKFPHLAFNNDNLQVLCKKCNMLKSDIKIKDYRKKGQKVTISIIFSENNLLDFNKYIKFNFKRKHHHKAK